MSRPWRDGKAENESSPDRFHPATRVHGSVAAHRRVNSLDPEDGTAAVAHPLPVKAGLLDVEVESFRVPAAEPFRNLVGVFAPRLAMVLFLLRECRQGTVGCTATISYPDRRRRL